MSDRFGRGFLVLCLSFLSLLSSKIEVLEA